MYMNCFIYFFLFLFFRVLKMNTPSLSPWECIAGLEGGGEIAAFPLPLFGNQCFIHWTTSHPVTWRIFENPIEFVLWTRGTAWCCESWSLLSSFLLADVNHAHCIQKRKTAYISNKREQKKRSNRTCIREWVCWHDLCPGGFCISRLIGWDVDAIMMPIAFTSLVHWRHWWGFWLSLLWLPHVDKRLLKYWWP